MARLRKTPEQAAESVDESFRREVRIRQGFYDLMTLRELGDSSGIPSSTLCKRLANPGDFTVEELRRLIGAVEPDPLVLLATIGYSDKAIARLKKSLSKVSEGTPANIT